MRSFAIAVLIFFSFVPVVSAEALTVLDYSQCSHYLGLLSCNQATEVCATNPSTGLPGCFPKSQAANYVDHTTSYPDLATCNQKTNCPYACTKNTLAIPTVYFCSSQPPSTTVPGTQTSPPVVTAPPVQTGPPITTAPGAPIKLINPLGEGTTINSFLLNILSIITTVIGPVIVILMLVYVGFKFVVAQGDPGKISEARQMLLWTVVGALILLGAQVIASGIQATVQALSTGG